jgi:hypothetical protein
MDVSSTIMKKAAPVATAGIQSVNNVAARGLDADSVTLLAGPCSDISFTARTGRIAARGTLVVIL